jgi:hypothetical protein
MPDGGSLRRDGSAGDRSARQQVSAGQFRELADRARMALGVTIMCLAPAVRGRDVVVEQLPQQSRRAGQLLRAGREWIPRHNEPPAYVEFPLQGITFSVLRPVVIRPLGSMKPAG